MVILLIFLKGQKLLLILITDFYHKYYEDGLPELINELYDEYIELCKELQQANWFEPYNKGGNDCIAKQLTDKYDIVYENLPEDQKKGGDVADHLKGHYGKKENRVLFTELLIKEIEEDVKKQKDELVNYVEPKDE